MGLVQLLRTDSVLLVSSEYILKSVDSRHCILIDLYNPSFP